MRFQLNEPDVIQEVIGGEALIVHTRTGSYYSLQGGGIRIWEALLAGRSVGQVAGLFAAADDGDRGAIRDGVEAFVASLQAEQLIRADDRPELAGDAPAPAPGFAYEAPTLQKFTDMQELLLVDPIHEVDPQAGWPLPRDPA